MDHAPDVGQADAGALELLRAVQPLEDAEELLDVLHVEAHTVVADEEDELARLLPGSRSRCRPADATRVNFTALASRF